MIKLTSQLGRAVKSTRYYSKESRVLKSSILKVNPLLIPQVTFSKQLKVDLLRCFSSSSIANYYRPPKNFATTGLIGRLWSRIPDTVKILGIVSVSAYLVIFVALPMFIIIVPPIVLGGWLFSKFNKYSRNKRLERVWEIINDSTLIYKPQRSSNPLLVNSPEDIHNHIAQFEINRIIDAFWKNEQGVADYFKINSIDDLALGTLEASEYNYNSTSILFADDYFMLVTQQRPLYDKSSNKEIATVITNLKCLERPIYEGMIDPSANIGKSLVMIEVIPNALMSPTFVLKTPSVSTSDVDHDDVYVDNDGYINVKGETKNL